MIKVFLCFFMTFILSGCFAVMMLVIPIENGGKTFSWTSKSDTTSYDKRQTNLDKPEIVV